METTNHVTLQPYYDTIVIGGGPAGATYATLMADAGKSVLVLEAAKFPRFA
ncbi:MAG: NAD(P)-binding protein, partial [Bacteroidetes bacterium]|nr:NAD(P)-binding protein [Bacteroidota bacterium]